MAVATDTTADAIDELDERALTQYLSVLDDIGHVRHAEDMYVVVSESGTEYVVDARLPACECPDHQYRDRQCKHIRRVQFATGEREIPDVDGVDPQLGEHIDGGVQ